MDTPFFPRPYFGRDIIDDLGRGQMLATESGHLEVEGRIIDEDEYVRLVGQQGLLGDTEITANLAEVSEDGGKAHEGHMAYMLMDEAPGGRHTVAAEA